MTESPIEPTDPWISLAEVSRQLRVHPSTVKSMALAGQIRYLGITGMRTRYHRGDVERIRADADRLAAPAPDLDCA